MIEIDLACNKRKDLKKQSNDRHVAKWNGVKVPFFLQIFTQVKVKVCCNKTTPKITIYPKSYSSICNGVNVARSCLATSGSRIDLLVFDEKLVNQKVNFLSWF